MLPNPELERLAGDLIRAAEHEDIPAPVQDAFLPESLKVGPFTLAPVHFASLLLLHSAKSPFVTGEPITADSLLMAVATAVYILATPWRTVRTEVERGDVGNRVWETAAQIPAMSPEEMQAAVAAIAAHINKGFATALPMQPPGQSDESAQKKTPASDGGS